MENKNVPTTTERIIAAAIEVLAQKTISGTRMKLIAEEAQMGASNILYYYNTKQDLLYAVLTEIQHRSTTRRDRIMAKAEPTLKGKLSGFFESKYTMIRHDPHVDTIQFDFWIQGLTDNVEIRKRVNQSYAIWRSDIKDILQEYVPNMDETRREMVAYIMVSMMMGASLQYYNNLDKLDLKQYFSTCLDMMLSWIGDSPKFCVNLLGGVE